jgi:hypothetical protein
MKVICKQTTSEGFDLMDVKTVFANDHDYNIGGYGIELKKEYIVMGIILYRNSNYLYYLIDTNGRPDWYPNGLFQVVNNSLPSNWFMKIYLKEEALNIYSLIGFDELCNLERDENAMRIYFKRKMELEYLI